MATATVTETNNEANEAFLNLIDNIPDDQRALFLALFKKAKEAESGGSVLRLKGQQGDAAMDVDTDGAGSGPGPSGLAATDALSRPGQRPDLKKTALSEAPHVQGLPGRAEMARKIKEMLGDNPNVQEVAATLQAIGVAMDADYAHFSDSLRCEAKMRENLEKKNGQEISDLQRLYAKYCFLLFGPDLPKQTREEDTVAVVIRLLREKYGIKVDSSDMSACHRNGPQEDASITIRFISLLPDSPHHQLCNRWGNWNGEKGCAENSTSLKVFARQMGSKMDKEIESLLQWIRERDILLKKTPSETRVLRYSKDKSGKVSYQKEKTGRRRVVTDPEAILKMMTKEEIEMYGKGLKPNGERRQARKTRNAFGNVKSSARGGQGGKGGRGGGMGPTGANSTPLGAK